jgi:hypothetical protein
MSRLSTGLYVTREELSLCRESYSKHYNIVWYVITRYGTAEHDGETVRQGGRLRSVHGI